MIGNLETRLRLLDRGAACDPVSFNEPRAGGTCYLCCPSAAYVDYARAEFRHFRTFRLLVPLLDILVGVGLPLIRLAKLDHQVQPNNWLLATNLVPRLTREEIVTVTEALAAAEPERAIVWRSINDRTDRAVLDAFAAAGYGLFPARQIYLFDCRATPPRRGRDETRDGRLLAQTDYAIVSGAEFTAADFVRAEQLYRLLYLDKYTRLNPHYTATFLRAMAEAGVLAFAGLRNRTGALDGVIAFFEADDTMTAPIVGYETSLPQALGLYRRLMALAARRARAGRLLLNMSAGAAAFKRNRGGVAAIEYSAVFTRHLPLRHRVAAWLVRVLLNAIGLPLLRRFEL